MPVFGARVAPSRDRVTELESVNYTRISRGLSKQCLETWMVFIVVRETLCFLSRNLCSQSLFSVIIDRWLYSSLVRPFSTVTLLYVPRSDVCYKLHRVPLSGKMLQVVNSSECRYTYFEDRAKCIVVASDIVAIISRAFMRTQWKLASR